jgi:hypothetical protein
VRRAHVGGVRVPVVAAVQLLVKRKTWLLHTRCAYGRGLSWIN